MTCKKIRGGYTFLGLYCIFINNLFDYFARRFLLFSPSTPHVCGEQTYCQIWLYDKVSKSVLGHFVDNFSQMALTGSQVLSFFNF